MATLEELPEGTIVTSWMEGGWFKVINVLEPIHTLEHLDEGTRRVALQKVASRQGTLIKKGYLRHFDARTLRVTQKEELLKFAEMNIQKWIKFHEEMTKKFPT